MLESCGTHEIALAAMEIVLVTERLMPERVPGFKLTESRAKLRFIYALGCAELISKSVSFIIIWTHFVYSENVLISKIIS